LKIFAPLPMLLSTSYFLMLFVGYSCTSTFEFPIIQWFWIFQKYFRDNNDFPFMERKFICQLDWVFKKLFSVPTHSVFCPFSLCTTGSIIMFTYFFKKILVENKLTGLTCGNFPICVTRFCQLLQTKTLKVKSYHIFQ